MNNGWIKTHRSILEWRWWDKPATAHLFIHCLLKACHEDMEWHGIEITRGSFVTTLANLERETGLTRQEIRTGITRLKSTHEITQQTTHEYSIITITNYDTYQYQPEVEQHTIQHTIQHTSNTPLTHEQHTSNTHNKNNKNIIIKEDKNNISSSHDARVRAREEREEEIARGGVVGEIDKLAEELKKEIQNGGSVAESAMRLYGVLPEELLEYVGWFVDKLNLDGMKFKSRSDFRMHFNNWLRIQVQQKVIKQQNNGKQNGPSDEYIMRTAQQVAANGGLAF